MPEPGHVFTEPRPAVPHDAAAGSGEQVPPAREAVRGSTREAMAALYSRASVGRGPQPEAGTGAAAHGLTEPPPPPPPPPPVDVWVEPPLPTPEPRTPIIDIVPELVSAAPAEPESALRGPGTSAPPPFQKVRGAKPKTPPQTVAEGGAKAPKSKPAKQSEWPAAAKLAFSQAAAKAVPAVTNAASRSALWVAHNLRRRELRKRYGEALVFTHNRVLDRNLERLFFVPTLKGARIAPSPDRNILYDGPVPGRVFDWAMAFLPKDLRGYAFIDFRAGSGRPMLLAAKHNFDRIIGFEFNAQAFDDLQMNIAQYPRSLMACRNIDCYRGDLDGVSIPDQPSVLYFQAAWREEMLGGVMDYVRETYRQSPRQLYVVLENADEGMSLEQDGIFRRLEPALQERVKLKLLSPLEFQVYSSAA